VLPENVKCLEKDIANKELKDRLQKPVVDSDLGATGGADDDDADAGNKYLFIFQCEQNRSFYGKFQNIFSLHYKQYTTDHDPVPQTASNLCHQILLYTCSIGRICCCREAKGK
jgi:hypothetical protein